MRMTLVALLLLLVIPGLGRAQTGQVVVATRRIQMKTGTVFVKLPVEAQQGERWEIVKLDKKKVELTFGS